MGDTEGRRSADVAKQARKADKKVKELQFQLEDEKRAVANNVEAAEKLNQKVNVYRLKVEELEGKIASLNSKYKKAAIELKEADERGNSAEQALQKLRARTRSASQAPTRGASRAPRTPKPELA